MGESKKLYIPASVYTEAETNSGHTIPLTWHEGQIGAMPVFGSVEAAHKIFGAGVDIVVIQTNEEKNDE